LLPAAIDPGCVDFIVSPLLEKLKTSLKFVDRGNSAPGFHVRVKGHQPENYAGLEILDDKRHLKLQNTGDRGEKVQGDWREGIGKVKIESLRHAAEC
jgi:hypothetical protein